MRLGYAMATDSRIHGPRLPLREDGRAELALVCSLVMRGTCRIVSTMKNSPVKGLGFGLSNTLWMSIIVLTTVALKVLRSHDDVVLIELVAPRLHGLGVCPYRHSGVRHGD